MRADVLRCSRGRTLSAVLPLGLVLLAACGRSSYVQRDAGLDAPSASEDTGDTGVIGDASSDAPLGAEDAGSDAGPETAARPLAPWSGAAVSSRRPAFRFALSGRAEAGRVEICADRACGTIVASIDAVGSAVPMVDLPRAPRALFWRVTPLVGGAVAGPTSATWGFRARYDADASALDACAGTQLDVDGDGLAEIAIADPTRGEIRVFAGAMGGPATTPTWTVSGPAGLGTSLSHAGDPDGDGLGELLVGSPGEAVVLWARLLPGGMVSATRLVGAAGSRFGAVVRGLGDIDGDGYSDVAVAEGATGRVLVFTGSAGGLTATPARVLTSPMGETDFGTALAGGDFDADGHADLAIGAPSGGHVYVHFGSATGLQPTARSTLSGTAASGFGASLVAHVDLDHDGRSDLAISSPASSEVQIFHGTSAGLATSSAGVSGGGADFGRVIAGLSDVDQNGFDDLLVSDGANGAWIYLGNARGLGASMGWIQAQAAPMGTTDFGATLADVGDVDGDNYVDGVIAAPASALAFLYLGSGAGFSRSSRALSGPAGGSWGAAIAGP